MNFSNLTAIARNITLVLILGFFTSKSEARHIIGGDVTYRCVLIDSAAQRSVFEIVFTLYRDSKSGGAPLNSPAEFGIHIGSGNNWQFYSVLDRPVEGLVELDPEVTNPCVILPPNLGVERGTYKMQLTLPWSTSSYMISYQRCCRNGTISNIFDPGNEGAAFSVEIKPEAQTSCNNSPKFNNFPPIVICVNTLTTFDHSAFDEEGDSLVYSFCAPLAAGGTLGSTGGDPTSCQGVTPNPARCPPPFDKVQYISPFYSIDKPLGINSQGEGRFTLDPETGILQGIPTTLGQFVVGVCVKEYRNGQLLSEIQRDFQFNVAFCQEGVTAEIAADEASGKSFVINSCGPLDVDLINKSTEERFISEYYWSFNIKGQEVVKTTKDATYTFPELGTYNGVMYLNRSIAGCEDTAYVQVNVYPPIDAKYTYAYDECEAGPVLFTNQSVSGAGPITKHTWIIEGDSINTINPIYTYRESGEKTVSLIVEDRNNCRDTLTQNFLYQPVTTVVTIEPNRYSGCVPMTVQFQNTSYPYDSTYTFKWNFGDGKTSGDINPIHIYEDVGTYTVSLEIISPNGCENDRLFANIVQTIPSPKADFDYNPKDLSGQYPEVNFTSLSSNAFRYFWRFADNAVSVEKNPTYFFQDTGIYEVMHIVLLENGCTDTATAILDIAPNELIQFPNAFTPNNDNLNDQFLPKGLFELVQDYNFAIFDRWGGKIFETSNTYEGWDGTYKNEESQRGVYIYVVEYLDARNIKKTHRGHFTLLR